MEHLTGAPHPSWSDAPFDLPTQCGLCRHYGYDAMCSAYPLGIPLPILAGRVSHTVHQPGDRGIRWEPAPPSTTDGPVRYVPMRQLVSGTWRVTGALWIGVDGSMGFEAAPAFMASPEYTAWLGMLRYAWRLGRTPRQVFAYWSRYNNGYTLAAGRLGRADSLAELRHATPRATWSPTRAAGVNADVTVIALELCKLVYPA